jgi:hypothetical protein
MVIKTPTIRSLALSRITSEEPGGTVREVCNMVRNSNVVELFVDKSIFLRESLAALAMGIRENHAFTALGLYSSELDNLQPLIEVAASHLRFEKIHLSHSVYRLEQGKKLRDVLSVRQSARSKVMTTLVGAHHTRDRIRTEQVTPCHLMTLPRELLRRLAEML